ncbi:MAG: gliding motility-associated C-terminal domain-containing protein [Chitinophagaceae bacterium]|nr:gliding motility-associated C-terminal domain-containing protein [Chitinophagaceae bacterium]
MKKILLLTLIFCFALILNSETASASHAAGGELVYELVPGTTNTYKFIFKFYRDCDGIAAPTTVTMCYTNNCGAAITSVTLNNYGQLPSGVANGSPVSTGCPGYPTQCNGGTTPGYQEWWYTANVTLPSTCNAWRFWVSISARNTAINNLNNPGAQNLYIETLFDNTVSQNNNSPYFSNPPISYFCINQPVSLNFGAIDVNGDSLYFESIQPRTGPGCTTTLPTNIPYTTGSGYNPLTNPFNTNSTFNINSSTGAVNFTPAQTGASVITIKVSEYRNGVLIGYVMRDIQLIIGNCNTPSPIMGIDTLTVNGGQLLNGVVQGCAGDSLNFCFNLTSTNPTAILVPSDNSVVSTPGSTIVYSNTLTDSIYACFSWATTALDTGLHVLTITVKDSSCAPPGFLISNTFSIPININPITQAFVDTSICLGDSTQLLAFGGSQFHWTVLPGGDDSTSMSCTYCNNPWVSPTSTTSYVVTSDLTSICNKSIDTVTIVVATGPQLTITPDTTTCVNASLQLNVSASPAGQAYNYTWSPATFLNNSTIANPMMVNPTAPTNYTVTVSPQGVLACASQAVVQVDVLLGYDIANSDTAICDGASVQINPIGGNPKYTYLWTPSAGVSNTGVLGPAITPTPPGVYTYSITASYAGCPDSTQDITITVDPNPVVDAGADEEICLGDTVHLHATVTPGTNYTYEWLPSADLNNNTILDPIFDGVATTVFTLTATSPNGCQGIDNMIVSVVPVDFLVVDGDRNLCPNQTATLTVSGGVSYLWNPAMYTSDSTASNITVNPISTTTFYVYGYDAKGCKDTAKAVVVVNPGAVLDAGDNQTIYPGESAQLYAHGNCSFFSWFPPNGLNATDIKNPIATPSVSTRYFVTAQTEAGCSAVDSVDVIVSPESLMELPNAFSPGSGTSLNDELRIILRGVATLNSFRVFNRWGQQVFSTTDITKGWNGQYNGKPQPMGSYVYVIDAVSNTGKRFYKQGNVTLVR